MLTFALNKDFLTNGLLTLDDLKQTYQSLLARYDFPLFMQDWWLDAVCGGANWQPFFALDGGGEAEAAMVVYYVKKWSILTINLPHLTPFSGIWFRPMLQQMKAHSLAEREVVLTQKLIEKLPKVAFFAQQFHFSFQNCLSFYWAGFRQVTRYTYFLKDLSDLNLIFDNFKGNIRTSIKKAERIVTISESEDCSSFYDFVHQSLLLKKVGLPFGKKLLVNLNEVLSAKKQRTIYLALDAEGNTHAAIYVAWDSTTTYLLLTGVNREFTNSAALSLLIWQAIQDASKRAQSFDFEGSMLPKVEPFFRSFGGERKSYYRISKAGNKAWELLFTLLGKL